jgi:hypothetical protein
MNIVLSCLSKLLCISIAIRITEFCTEDTNARLNDIFSKEIGLGVVSVNNLYKEMRDADSPSVVGF